MDQPGGPERLLDHCAHRGPVPIRTEGCNQMRHAADTSATRRLTQNLGAMLLAGAPNGLLARVRWLFLLYALLTVVVTVAQLGLSDTPALQLRVLAALGLGWLALFWVHGFRRGSFPVIGDLGAALVLFLVGVTLANPARVLTLIYAGVLFRALYGSVHRVVLWAALTFFALLGSSVVVAMQPEEFVGGYVGFAVIQIPTLGFVTGLVLLVARIINQAERASARERILSHASSALMRSARPDSFGVASLSAELNHAQERDRLNEAALETVMLLLQGTGLPATQVQVWEGITDEFRAVAARGSLAERVRRRTLQLRSLPPALAQSITEGHSIAAVGDEAALWAGALGLPRHAGAVLVQPLVVRRDLRSILTIVSDQPLPRDVTDALDTLSTQIRLVGELRQSERRFRSVVQNSSDVVTVVGPDATIRYVSPSVERVFGYAPIELQNVWMDDLAHPDDRAALLGYLYTASRQPEVTDVVHWRWRDSDGHWRDVETVGTNLVHMPDVAGVVLNTRDVSERRALERERAHLLDKTVQAAEEERTKVAADLHDGPIQRLTTMGYDLARSHRWLQKQDMERGRTILESAQKQLSTEINGLRELMVSLRPPVLDEVGLVAALHDHVKGFESRNGIQCILSTTLDRRLDPDVETALYRVAQEALTNVQKHAQATHAWVGLEVPDDGKLHLHVQDDGRGFSSEDTAARTRAGHFGLIGMHQRVRMAGGTFDIRSEPGQGTHIEATFPLPESPDSQSQDPVLPPEPTIAELRQRLRG